ncbi:unnamed protein product [Brassicogethes aeneus]|uniref:Chromo domain-containing protein n=1 Tax=Brassicogethes aeneus TaxID=1431903 RepID=A0A9P0B356_BRAAE|nr:unnamed protein product [Brassicogethes aeneus]
MEVDTTDLLAETEKNAEPEASEENPPEKTEEPVEKQENNEEKAAEEPKIPENDSIEEKLAILDGKFEDEENKAPVQKPTEMSETEVYDELAKDSTLITAAQEEVKKLDLLVCGICHDVYNFLEDFQKHKLEPCTPSLQIKNACENEGKPQVWGFSLWKVKQLKSLKKGEEEPTSWIIYQKWCKLEPAEKQVWIAAGEMLQTCVKIGNAKLNEVKSDPLSLEEVLEGEDGNSSLLKKSIYKPVKLNDDVTILPSSKNGETNRAVKIIQESVSKECVVEKIVYKRFNPRRKTFEYQIKWEGFDDSQNTWEPPGNLTGCKKMLEEFEEWFKKHKTEQKLNGTPKGRGRPKMSHSTPKTYTPPVAAAKYVPSVDSSGRPQRASKQKALNQVKSWCGNISDADDGGVKRPYEDDDSDDSFEKKIKMGDYSDSEDEKPKFGGAAKKFAAAGRQGLHHVVTSSGGGAQTVTIMNNGVGSKIPQNVLIPDANGVVRINQKQLPSLSTGVYIMSKTAGIIKLDSTTSKVATSGGQTIVKVAPKIGQTQIKIVKKDANAPASPSNAKVLQMTTTTAGGGGGGTPKPQHTTPAPKSYKPVITKVKKSEAADKAAKLATQRAKEEAKAAQRMSVDEEDESDDGIPELEFPTDLPVPEPDSPPGDFVLDPETGKIVGQDYPLEAAVVINESPIALGQPSSTLENIVKLAAADITEEDLKGDPLAESAPMDVAEEENNLKPEIAGTSARNDDDNSILNKALTNSNILQKKLVSPKPKIQQRILNHSMSGGRSSLHTVQTVRQVGGSPSSAMRAAKPTPPRAKFNLGAGSAAQTQYRVSEAGAARNVYSKTTVLGTNNMRTKIGHTTVYRSISGTQSKPGTPSRVAQHHAGANVSVYKAPRREPISRPAQLQQQQPQKPKVVISMPSLVGDDEPAAAPVLAAPAEPAPAPAEAQTAAEADLGAAFALGDNEQPIFITGDDGTVYQVAGQNEQGQTILITQGSDGQQQCLLVTNDAEAGTSTGDDDEEAACAEASAAPAVLAVGPAAASDEAKAEATEPLSIKTGADDSGDQVVAQVVRAEPPSPGGTHKVVVMLPDGNLMMTQVSPEEYASLELD